jgi:hypothetical protein
MKEIGIREAERGDAYSMFGVCIETFCSSINTRVAGVDQERGESGGIDVTAELDKTDCIDTVPIGGVC